ncbi:uncharacterized protein PAC_05623 [Phialocephala subalpina]|uniref:T6SS Phospholipase effector Tle1-like catalytic domain-containing protein n=1 Tax=Phialocephala subalpina TaxID=576137 RepID=A0A1L7WSJ6_9HELO|nr:uncharacterized protein PAC_05623 [Phialocephala subalpina]
MAPAMSRLAPHSQRTRTPRILLIPFDGTWASHLGKTPTTVISEFSSLIATAENVDNGYRKGVGTKGGLIDKVFGGALGSGLVLNVLEAFIKLAGDYQIGDTIVIIGFSRGAFTARVFAALTSLVGLLKTQTVSEARKKLFYQKIHKGLVSGDLWNNDTLDEVRDGYQFYDDIPIDALCLFDTVASLGVPKVGAGSYIAPVMRMLPQFRKDYAHFERVMKRPPNSARHVFQAISVQEARATYREQVAQKQSRTTNQVFKQMWFAGNHGNMAQDNGRSGFADAPLAWMIGQLHHYLRVRFDEGKLHMRFPSYHSSKNLAGACVTLPPSAAPSASDSSNRASNSTFVQATGVAPTGSLPRWIYNDVKAPGAFKTFCHGWNQRTPGRYGELTFEEVHITVRLRGFGLNRADASMVPGYYFVDDGRRWVWRRLPQEKVKTLRWIAGDKKPAPMPFIDEGKMLPLEAALLGLSWCLDA